MKREYALAVAALTVLIAAVTTLALTGAVSDPAEPDEASAIERPGTVSLLEVTFTADEVSGETAALDVDTYLEHEGDPVENVTVVHRVTNAKNSLVVDVTERGVGTVDAESEEVVSQTIDVPREGTHRIETFVYANGTRTESKGYRVSGVDSLTPEYADTGLDFHRFGGDYGGALADVPAIEYSIVSTDGDTVELEVSSYLTNAGDDPATDLELELKARQADSNIVADTVRIDLPDVDPGETATPTATIEVPDEYAYHLDGILWLDGTIVATDRAPADLRPDSVVENESNGDDALDTSDFEDDGDDGFETTEDDAGADYDDGGDAHGDDGDGDRNTAEDANDGTPGFGAAVAAAAIALLATITLTRRQTHD